MDKIAVVEKMQEYLKRCGKEEGFSMEKLYQSVGYTKRHADRLFRELLHMTPAEYLRAVRLSKSAEELTETDKSVLEIALDCHYSTHEGYTRAFEEQFSTTPQKYRSGKTPIPLFRPSPVSHYYILRNQKERTDMEEKTTLCTTSAVERQKRKLILLRAKKATDYLSFCAECGCDWHGLLESIPSKLDAPALLSLPPFLMKEGYTSTACGVEVPFDYAGEVPEGYELVELPPCTMLYFQTEPFEREEDFPVAIGLAFAALERYDFERYGYVRADEDAPLYNFGFSAAKGASLAVAVRKINR